MLTDKVIAWLQEDERKNIIVNGITFLQAKEVIENQASVQIRNLHGDFAYIGLTDDLMKIIYVYCIEEDGFRRIKRARLASNIEAAAFFAALAKGEK
ncbi:MAG TPA: hypothetical protein VNJ08_02725 [Bacteriovoracaceae bacterium]|nr:hypothetical protein [Bacteriovoracaceae bacterium]